jgi:hypothetical protein
MCIRHSWRSLRWLALDVITLRRVGRKLHPAALTLRHTKRIFIVERFINAQFNYIQARYVIK